MSSFGRYFRVSTFGESHCKGVGCIIDGVPPRFPLTTDDIQPQLTRRRPGQSHLTTGRNEADQVTILSGTEFGVTLGTPIALFVANRDHRPKDYSNMVDVPRPSHADYTYQVKYGIRASSGGGRSSARETIGRVASGAVAETWLRLSFGVEIVAWVSSVRDVVASRALEQDRALDRARVDETLVRCPDPEAADLMRAQIELAKEEHDSVGGVVTCVCRNVPEGIGEPAFDKLEAMLAHAMLSIPATKGFEIGSGFDGTKMRGSEHNDAFVAQQEEEEEEESGVDASPAAGATLSSAARAPGGERTNRLATATNNSGGIQGGISNGQDIVFRVAFKPPATIGREQETASFDGEASTLAARGRHDPCVVPRAVPIVEASAALVIADAVLAQLSRVEAASAFPLYGRIGAHNAPDGAAASAALPEALKGKAEEPAKKE